MIVPLLAWLRACEFSQRRADRKRILAVNHRDDRLKRLLRALLGAATAVLLLAIAAGLAP